MREYDAQGWHRTGTKVDAESAEWLAEHVRALGLQVELEPFAINRVEPVEAYVEIDGRREYGVPLFDCTYTDGTGVVGAVGVVASACAIGVGATDVGRPTPDVEAARHTARHRAMVVAVRPIGNDDGLALQNAEYFTQPFGPPVLQLRHGALEWLQRAADDGSTGRVVATARYVPSQAYNVVAQLSGADRSLPPVWVMTPRSGWWACAGERAGGIAGWLEAMAAMVWRQPARAVNFLASSGHELGHLGLRKALETRQDSIQASYAWVHLGANIGAAPKSTSFLAASNTELQAEFAQLLASEGVASVVRRPPGRAQGEALEIHRGGGTYVSILGSHQLFHQEADRYPAAVSIEEVARIARAVRALVDRLTE
ncbi:MAG: hypothetical protein M3P30_14430 [Chloroflexota bacterium]|nr:hypothetical protein [Chloroflexota bacterium]